jgi:hypothetical protein
MNRTLRDQIKRRMGWCIGAFVCGWVLIGLGTEVARSMPAVPRELLPLIGVALFAAGALAMNFLVKCPKCHARLARTIAMPVAFSFGSGPKVCYCPYCGVSLDEPIPLTGPQAGNPIHPA